MGMTDVVNVRKIGWMGIDPGKKGSLAIIDSEGNIVFLDWPKNSNLLTFFSKAKNLVLTYKIKTAVLERVHSMPKQGVASTFSFGENFGMWRAFLLIYRIPHILVPPQTWAKGLFCRDDGKTTKDRAVNAAMRLFPEAELTNENGTILDGRADALLMAYYAKVHGGELDVEELVSC